MVPMESARRELGLLITKHGARLPANSQVEAAKQSIALARKPLKEIAQEYIAGLLNATFQLEDELGEANFSDQNLANEIMQMLEEAADWVRLLVKSCQDAGTLIDTNAPAKPPHEPTSRADAIAALQSMTAADVTKFEDDVPQSVAPEALVVGVDEWEALCWRRGALRYYIISSRVKETVSGASDCSKRNDETGAAVAAHVKLIDEGIDALQQLLRVRAVGLPVGSNQLLEWGIYSTTHLLALAYAGELEYYRWTALLNDASGPDSEDAHLDQLKRALRLVHRYLHVVQVKMQGCEWSEERALEFMRLMGGIDSLSVLLHGEWGSREEVQSELDRISVFLV